MKAMPLSGQHDTGGDHGLRIRFAKTFTDTHNFSGRVHFGTQDRVDTGDFSEGKDRRLDIERSTVSSCGRQNSDSFCPAITSAAMRAMGTPVAFETKGTVRDARGLTSST